MAFMYLRIDKIFSEEAGKFVLPDVDVNRALALMQSWDVKESAAEREEQRETWEYLKKAIDEDRLSDRKLFP